MLSKNALLTFHSGENISKKSHKKVKIADFQIFLDFFKTETFLGYFLTLFLKEFNRDVNCKAKLIF